MCTHSRTLASGALVIVHMSQWYWRQQQQQGRHASNASVDVLHAALAPVTAVCSLHDFTTAGTTALSLAAAFRRSTCKHNIHSSTHHLHNRITWNLQLLQQPCTFSTATTSASPSTVVLATALLRSLVALLALALLLAMPHRRADCICRCCAVHLGPCPLPDSWPGSPSRILLRWAPCRRRQPGDAAARCADRRAERDQASAGLLRRRHPGRPPARVGALRAQRTAGPAADVRGWQGEHLRGDVLRKVLRSRHRHRAVHGGGAPPGAAGAAGHPHHAAATSTAPTSSTTSTDSTSSTCTSSATSRRRRPSGKPPKAPSTGAAAAAAAANGTVAAGPSGGRARLGRSKQQQQVQQQPQLQQHSLLSSDVQPRTRGGRQQQQQQHSDQTITTDQLDSTAQNHHGAQVRMRPL
ncbi:hypothetical protein COO60DRAFT_577356 [Scenedesmus sp. NREL 46B-D3]|nr:hypothetical protein COO60DRAFT_577356 [Scenedesmus sp. NREL 46B-D3]